MSLTMKLLPALVAATFAGCGGGGDNQTGSTTPASARLNTLTACVDINHNWQCDDGDTNIAATAVGSQNLSPSAGQAVLLETRDTSNQRTRLLVSQTADVTGMSTLRTMLGVSGKTIAEIAAIEATLTTAYGSQLESLLANGYANALTTTPIALAALSNYSTAVAAQSTTTPGMAAYAPTLGSSSTDATWTSTDASTVRRQLSAQSSTVLNNSESNRLYLFDATAASLSGSSGREIDLIPPPTSALAGYPKLLRQSFAVLDKVLSVFIDTASAATGFNSAPTTGSSVVLPPGKGIAGIQLADGGKSAFVLLNMLAASYTGADCVGTSDGTEGLFKVGLTDTASYRALKTAPACIHSGFSLIAADATGARLAAWDATAQKLWLLDGSTMARRRTVDLKFDINNPPQALALTPGGRYLVAAGYGRLTLVDMETGDLVTQLTGDWANVAQISFAGGARRLLVASGTRVFTVRLDNSLQYLSTAATGVAGSGETLRTLSVSTDGDSYTTTSDSKAYWRSTAASASLGSSNLPAGLAVQQATLTANKLIVLARGSQDQQFKLLRLPISLPSLPTL